MKPTGIDYLGTFVPKQSNNRLNSIGYDFKKGGL